MLDTCKSYAALSGRLLLCAIFLMSGIGKIMDWSSATAAMTRKGMVAVDFFLAGAVAFELIGGLSVLLGYRARLGAVLLILFLIPVTPIFHNFWIFSGPERMNQMNHFMKNVALMGGLLVLVAHGAGRFSIDACRRAAEEKASEARHEKEPVMVG